MIKSYPNPKIYLIIVVNYGFWQMRYFRRLCFYCYNRYHTIDDKVHENNENDNCNSTYALPEKTKRGPPTNKNISVRNISAQISNMSINENAGLKREYQVRFII